MNVCFNEELDSHIAKARSAVINQRDLLTLLQCEDGEHPGNNNDWNDDIT